MLDIRNLRKSFNDGSSYVISKLSLQLPEAGIYCLMGANGAGKTTLFNIITGFTHPQEGSVLYKGIELKYRPPYMINRIGIVRTFQDLRLATKLTVKENLILSMRDNPYDNVLNALFYGCFFKRKETVFIERATQIAEQIGLTDKFETSASDLSYGQQKLLSLGCCIANDANLMLLDEPAAGINPLFCEKIASILKDLKSKGKTILIIEHNKDFLREVGDAYFFLTHGRLFRFDSYEELRHSPLVLQSYF